jgi:lysyl-tRNA synthetase class 1
MFKRIVGARNISIEDIPTYMDEFDELESYYFSKDRETNQLKDARLRGLYEYTVLTRAPAAPSVHVPYKQVAELAATAPEGTVVDYVTRRLVANGAVEGASPDLAKRIGWASKWAHAVALRASGPAPVNAETKLSIDARTTDALRRFADALDGCNTPDDVQAAAFDAVKKSGTTTAQFFSAVYRILVGTERGPRLGPYVIDAGRGTVREKLERALERAASAG